MQIACSNVGVFNRNQFRIKVGKPIKTTYCHLAGKCSQYKLLVIHFYLEISTLDHFWLVFTLPGTCPLLWLSSVYFDLSSSLCSPFVMRSVFNRSTEPTMAINLVFSVIMSKSMTLTLNCHCWQSLRNVFVRTAPLMIPGGIWKVYF